MWSFFLLVGVIVEFGSIILNNSVFDGIAVVLKQFTFTSIYLFIAFLCYLIFMSCFPVVDNLSIPT